MIQKEAVNFFLLEKGSQLLFCVKFNAGICDKKYEIYLDIIRLA
jgi:hypothetical protein